MLHVLLCRDAPAFWLWSLFLSLYCVVGESWLAEDDATKNKYSIEALFSFLNDF